MKKWETEDYTTEHGDDQLTEASDFLWRKVHRKAWSAPGFAIWTLPPSVTSLQLRKLMIGLLEALSNRHVQETGTALEYQSLGRFNQQTTTKLHLDGAPPCSFLMLGYEPTEVRSTLMIADYARCADSRQMTPAEFLDQCNPMFPPHQEILRDFTLQISNWQEDHPRIVLINNSSTAAGDPLHSWGVMHGAAITAPDSNLHRIINSTMIAPKGHGIPADHGAIHTFQMTDQISGAITNRQEA